MGIQMLLCIESNKKAKTDWVYIIKTIKHYYKNSPEYSIKPIPMGGKMHYKDSSVTKQIKDYKEEYSAIGRTIVIYCIDTDNYHGDQNRKREFDEIRAYCERKGYELVWFCRDIEELYWGTRVESGEKVKKAGQFNRNNQIQRVPESALSSTVISKGKSNILVILDKHLERIH